jgi:hypothetical protein
MLNRHFTGRGFLFLFKFLIKKLASWIYYTPAMAMAGWSLLNPVVERLPMFSDILELAVKSRD